MTILTLSNLTKIYGDTPALSDVSLQINAGERVALLGHNGAGKSTLMKLILGLISPDRGEVAIANHKPGSAVARALTAYLPENAAFHPALTGREQIRHFLRLRGAPIKQADELLEKVGLSHAATRRIGTYSKGMRQRVGLAQALIGSPRLMILDEPTSGLDPISRREFYALLDDLASQGTAILLSSHALSEVEARTDRLIILSKGHKISEGTLGQLRADAALPFTVTLVPHTGQSHQAAQLFPEAEMREGKLVLSCELSDKMPLIKRMMNAAEVIEDFDFHAPSLDDIYAHISTQPQPKAA